MVDFSKQYGLLKSFLSTIKGKTLLIAHYDADGITSALLFSRILEKYNQQYNKDFFITIARDSYRGDYNKKSETKTYIKSFDNIILLDYCFDCYDDLIDKTVFVFDHHKSGEQNKQFILNPALSVDSTDLPSSSAIVYDFYYYLFGPNRLLKKIAFIGAASDFMIYGSVNYLHTNTEDIDLFMSNSILLKPIIFDITQNLQCIYESHGEELKLFEHLLNTTKTNLFGFFHYLPEHQQKILATEKEEFEHTKEILDCAEIDDKNKLIIINLNPKLKELKKYVLNILELMYADYTKIICIRRNKMFSCSLRSPCINLLEIINKLKHEITNFNGGGHSFAAGCAGPLTDEHKIIEEIKKQLSK